VSEQPKKPNAILPPPRTVVAGAGTPAKAAGRGYSMKDRQAKAMSKLLASFGPSERAEYEKLKQMRMKKKKRR
jgi:hypothetical protein